MSRRTAVPTVLIDAYIAGNKLNIDLAIDIENMSEKLKLPTGSQTAFAGAIVDAIKSLSTEEINSDESIDKLIQALGSLKGN